MLRPEVSGRVSRVGFVDGQEVKRGQVLIQLDDALQQAQLSQALAQAAIAQTNLQRQKDLVAQNFEAKAPWTRPPPPCCGAGTGRVEPRAAGAHAAWWHRSTAWWASRNVDLGDYMREGADIVAIEDLSAMRSTFAWPNVGAHA